MPPLSLIFWTSLILVFFEERMGLWVCEYYNRCILRRISGADMELNMKANIHKGCVTVGTSELGDTGIKVPSDGL
jgi:hypothetical protein